MARKRKVKKVVVEPFSDVGYAKLIKHNPFLKRAEYKIFFVKKGLGDEWEVYETNGFEKNGKFYRGGTSWEAFKTKSKTKALKVAKFLAEMSDTK